MPLQKKSLHLLKLKKNSQKLSCDRAAHPFFEMEIPSGIFGVLGYSFTGYFTQHLILPNLALPNLTKTPFVDSKDNFFSNLLPPKIT